MTLASWPTLSSSFPAVIPCIFCCFRSSSLLIFFHQGLSVLCEPSNTSGRTAAALPPCASFAGPIYVSVSPVATFRIVLDYGEIGSYRYALTPPFGAVFILLVPWASSEYAVWYVFLGQYAFLPTAKTSEAYSPFIHCQPLAALAALCAFSCGCFTDAVCAW